MSELSLKVKINVVFVVSVPRDNSSFSLVCTKFFFFTRLRLLWSVFVWVIEYWMANTRWTHLEAYPGYKGPFSKYLRWNKPCSRFDKAPETVLWKFWSHKQATSCSSEKSVQNLNGVADWLLPRPQGIYDVTTNLVATSKNLTAWDWKPVLMVITIKSATFLCSFKSAA